MEQWMTVVSICMNGACEYFYVTLVHDTLKQCYDYAQAYGDAMAIAYPDLAGQILCVGKEYVDPLIINNQIGIAPELDAIQ